MKIKEDEDENDDADNYGVIQYHETFEFHIKVAPKMYKKDMK